jgi:phenylacetate-CoA ligase
MNPWLARNLVYRPATWLRGEPVFSLLRRYEVSQWWDPARIRTAQEAALARLLRHAARRTEHYAALAREVGVDPARIEAADLEKLPHLTKADLTRLGPRLCAPRLPGTASWKTTGGSTGVPVRVRKNRYATACEQAASWRSYAWWGIHPGDRQARFWGTPLTKRMRLRYRAIDWVLNRDRFSAFAFHREDLMGYFQRLSKSRPTWAYGYASMLAQFGRFCLEEQLPLDRIGIRAVVSTSEVLAEADRELIGRAFGAPVWNEYGCGEVGAVLYQCSEGGLHLMAENLLAELVPDPTRDEPEACRLILTDLHNYATPLIRYDVGDRVIPAPPCGCGRGLPNFARVFGRAYDFVVAADGSRFHGEFFLYALETGRELGLPIHRAQFEQISRERILLRVVPGRGYRSEAGEWIARELERRSEGRFQLEVVEVEVIERERSGKIRLVKGLPEPGQDASPPEPTQAAPERRQR